MGLVDTFWEWFWVGILFLFVGGLMAANIYIWIQEEKGAEMAGRQKAKQIQREWDEKRQRDN